MQRDFDTEFNENYKQYYDEIYKYALSRLSCDSEYADDCTQEAFLVYYKRLKNGEIIQNPRAFIFKAASLYIKKRYTSFQKEQKHLTSLDDREHLLTDSKEQEIIERLNFKEFEDKLNELLSEEEKTLYRYRFREERRIKDISEIYGVKAHTITVRIARLRKKIISKLNDYYGKED